MDGCILWKLLGHWTAPVFVISFFYKDAPCAVNTAIIRIPGTIPQEKPCLLYTSRAFRMAPRKIAEILSSQLVLDGTFFERCEIAGPGFLNFFLSKRFYASILQDIEALGSQYGRSDYGKGEKVMVEFVSANPTGPMHMGNARGGALGDCLASVLDAAGYQVWREFYINDAGNQIDKFALSLDLRYQQIYHGEDAVPMPEDCYHGEDIIERAREFADLYGDSFLQKEEARCV